MKSNAFFMPWVNAEASNNVHQIDQKFSPTLNQYLARVMMMQIHRIQFNKYNAIIPTTTQNIQDQVELVVFSISSSSHTH